MQVVSRMLCRRLPDRIMKRPTDTGRRTRVPRAHVTAQLCTVEQTAIFSLTDSGGVAKQAAVPAPPGLLPLPLLLLLALLLLLLLFFFFLFSKDWQTRRQMNINDFPIRKIPKILPRRDLHRRANTQRGVARRQNKNHD